MLKPSVAGFCCRYRYCLPRHVLLFDMPAQLASLVDTGGVNSHALWSISFERIRVSPSDTIAPYAVPLHHDCAMRQSQSGGVGDSIVCRDSCSIFAQSLGNNWCTNLLLEPIDYYTDLLSQLIFITTTYSLQLICYLLLHLTVITTCYYNYW